MTAPLLPPEEGPGGESFVSFLFCSATDPRGIENFNKRAVSFSSGSQEGEDGSVRDLVSTTPVPLSLRQWAAGSRSEDAMPSPAPPAQPWSQVSVAPHTQTPLRDALPFESGPWAPLRCPTAGTSMSPLVPLVRPLGAWLELPRPSRWLLRTIRLGYAIQFARRPPKFRGNRFTSVLSQDAPVLRAEVAVLLAKDAIQPAPPAEMESGLYKGPYFIVPKKHGGLHPIWDLRVLNRALVKLPFKMLTQRRLFQCVRPFDWVAAIDLKDAYFHVSILPRFRFAYKGEHTSRPSPSGTSAGVQVNRGANSPLCRGSLWEEARSTSQRLSEERAQSMLRCLESLQRKRAVPLKHFQRLLGHMASSAAITPLGLLHMRPLQRWLHDRVPRWAWHHGTYRVSLTPSCRRTFSPWSDLAFFGQKFP